MNKRISRIVACIMIMVAVIFVVIAFNNPQLNWPWSNAVTYILYMLYLIIVIVLLIAPFKKK